MDINELSSRIIGAAIEVHKGLGPGLLESAYEECLCRELELKGIAFERQKPLPVTYKGKRLDCGYRLDIVVEDFSASSASLPWVTQNMSLRPLRLCGELRRISLCVLCVSVVSYAEYLSASSASLW